MNDQELAALRAAAEAGDRDAEDELVQGLAELGDADGLRHWAQRGNTDAEDLLVELASEREDHDELARLAAAGNTDAAAILAARAVAAQPTADFTLQRSRPAAGPTGGAAVTHRRRDTGAARGYLTQLLGPGRDGGRWTPG